MKISKKIISLFLILAVLLIAGTLSVKYALESRENLIENVIIKNYSFDREEGTLNAVVEVSIHNLNDKKLSSLPLKIAYYSDDGSRLATDFCDILKFSKLSLSPNSGEDFQIEVTCPEGTAKAEVYIER